MKNKFLKKLCLGILIAISLNGGNILAQFTNVMIDSASSPQEPTITINPLNTNQISVGSNWDYAFYSSDGGATWASSANLSTWTVDPCMKADSLGNIFYFYVINGLYGVFCQQSTDEGVSFLPETKAWTGENLVHDKDWAYIDPHTNSLYVTWTQYDAYNNFGPTDSSRIYFSKSTDNGASFTVGLRIDRIAGDCQFRDITDPHPSVGPNGEIYVTFMDSVGIRYNKSLDYGNTWLPAQPVIDSNGIYRYDSIQYVNTIRTMPYSDCDRSNSPYRGNIYVCWADQRNGKNNSDIFFSKSTNGGAVWSPTLKVNSDSSNRQQYRPAMTIDQTNGYIYMVFFDRRNYINNDSSDVYMAKSTNGGATWNDFKISTSGFINKSDIFEGDYIDISAVAGIIRPVWTRVDGSNSSIWTCLYNEPWSGIDEIREHGACTVYPNPSKGSFTLSLSNVNMKSEVEIYNILGENVLNETLRSTQDDNLINLTNQPNGVYFYRVLSENGGLIGEGKVVIEK
jgi:hypothetical protein